MCYIIIRHILNLLLLLFLRKILITFTMILTLFFFFFSRKILLSFSDFFCGYIRIENPIYKNENSEKLYKQNAKKPGFKIRKKIIKLKDRELKDRDVKIKRD